MDLVMLISYSYCAPNLPMYTCGYLFDLQLLLTCRVLLSDSKYGSSPHPTHCLPSTHHPSSLHTVIPTILSSPTTPKHAFLLCTYVHIWLCRCVAAVPYLMYNAEFIFGYIYRINKYEEKLAVMACLSYLCQQIEYHADTCVSSIITHL